jgi:hypothetical protein
MVDAAGSWQEAGMGIEAAIQEMVDRETRAWDAQDAEALTVAPARATRRWAAAGSSSCTRGCSTTTPPPRRDAPGADATRSATC